MNALALAAAARPARRGMAARRALIVLLAFEGVAAVCGAVALALGAPAASDLLGGSLGAQATIAALLLAGLSAALAVASFTATGALLRDRPGAELSAAGVQATYLVGGIVGLVSAGLVPELAVAVALGGVGLLLAALSFPSRPR
ncbi:MAG TPA: hypothetical protein VFM19_09385 [Candidatus Limnocylindria bacterium]|nr:hypothetical protein [Candidatus Limnocylindria bacterium]